MNKEQKNNLISTVILTAIIFIFIMVIPQFIALGKGGLAFDIFKLQFFSYSIWAIGYAMMIGLLYLAELLIIEKDAKYGNSLAYNSPGSVPALETKFFKNRWKLFLLSLIICSVAGLFVAFTGQSFTGIGSLEQQFTKEDDLVFRSSIIPAAENFGAAFVLAFIIFTIRVVSRKNNWSKAAFQVTSIIIGSLGVMSYGIINHLFRYAGSDVAMFSVGSFWLIGGLITVLSGSFIPFLVLHFSNNFFLDIRGLYSSDFILILTLGAIFLMSGLYYFVFGRKKK